MSTPTYKNSQNGHITVIVIVGLVIIAGVLFAGWRIQQAKNENNTQEQTNTGQNSPPEELPDDSSYFSVKDWGVRFALPQELQGDLSTYVSNTSSSGFVLFESKQVNNAIGDKSCALALQPDWGDNVYSGGIQASLVRLNPDTYPKESLDYYKSQLQYIKTIGDYEYYYRKALKDPPVSCGEVEQAVTSQLQDTFSTLELNP